MIYGIYPLHLVVKPELGLTIWYAKQAYRKILFGIA